MSSEAEREKFLNRIEVMRENVLVPVMQDLFNELSNDELRLLWEASMESAFLTSREKSLLRDIIRKRTNLMEGVPNWSASKMSTEGTVDWWSSPRD